MVERTRPHGAPHDPYGLTPASALEIAIAVLHDRADLTDLTVTTVEALWHGLVRRAERMDTVSMAEINDEFVVDFVNARNRDGSAPSIATKHLRRWAVHFFYQLLRQAGVHALDPAGDLELPPRASSTTRPLTEEEVVLCRSIVEYPADATLKASVWCLAESSATTSEICPWPRESLR